VITVRQIILLLIVVLSSLASGAVAAQPHIITARQSNEAIALESPTLRVPLAPFSPLVEYHPDTRLLIFVEGVAGATASTLAVEAATEDGAPVSITVEDVRELQSLLASQVTLKLATKFADSVTRIALAVTYQSQRSNEAWINRYGDVYVIAGQSNASGRGKNLQLSTNREAYLFGNDGRWKPLADPVDSSVDQIDIVSSDAKAAAGSVWPLVASAYPGRITFVPAANGGTRIEEWLPRANHEDRTTLYGSMIYRARRAGKIKAVLWWQGETDAVLGTPKDVYLAHLTTIANAIQEDLGVNLVPAKLQRITLTPHYLAINEAIDSAWLNNPNVTPGPDLSSLNLFDKAISSDGVHVDTDAGLRAAARLWARVITRLGPGTSNR